MSSTRQACGKGWYIILAGLLGLAGEANAQVFAVLTSAGLEVTRIKANGVSTKAGTVPLPPGTDSLANLEMSPDGQFIYVEAGKRIYVFGLAEDGTPTPVGNAPVSDPAGPLALAVTQTQVSAFNTDGSVNIFTRDSTSGALTPAPEPVEVGPAFAAGAGFYTIGPATVVQLDPKMNTLAVWVLGKSGWTKVGTYATGKNPVALGLDPSKRFVVVANRDDGTVSTFRRNLATEELTLVATTSVGTAPATVSVGPSSVNVGFSGGIKIFGLNAQTGVLTPMGQVNANPPAATVFSPGYNLFLSIEASGAGQSYTANSNSALTPLATFQTTGTNPRSLVFTGARATVTTLNDSGPGSLRQAILDARSPGTNISFQSNLQGTIPLGSTLAISNNTNIFALPGTIATSGPASGSAFAFQGDANSTIYGLNITGARAGSGVSIDKSNVTLDTVTLSGNSTPAQGGGFSVTGTSSVFLRSSTIQNNAAGNGGGGGYVGPGANVTIGNSNISRNNSNLGGGLDISGVLAIVNSIVSNNAAGNSGGGLFTAALGAVTTANNDTFTSNNAPAGGAVAADNGAQLFFNFSTFVNNITPQGGALSAGTNNGTFLAGQYNWIGANPQNNFNGTVGLSSGNNFITTTIPPFVVQANGTFLPTGNNGAIDAGKSVAGIVLDENGLFRPAPGMVTNDGAVVTLGAQGKIRFVSDGGGRVSTPSTNPDYNSLGPDLIVQVVDPAGNGVSGVTVIFTASPGGKFPSGTVLSIVTDSLGYATAKGFKPQNFNRGFSVQASVEGLETLTFNLTNDTPDDFPIVSPPSGAASVQPTVFTLNFYSPGGYQNAGVLNFLFNPVIDGVGACYGAILPTGPDSGSLFLVDQAGDAGGPFAGGFLLSGDSGRGPAGNGLCTIDGQGSSINGTGDSFTVSLPISFSPAFGGDKVVFAATRDKSGNTSGWAAKGVTRVAGAAQTTTTSVVGMNPARLIGSGPTPFTFLFSDTKGAGDMGVGNILINTSFNGDHGCYAAAAFQFNTLFLVNDAGNGLLPGQSLIAPGMLSNSQCTITWGSQAITTSGNNLSLALSYAFSGGPGDLIVYQALRDKNELNNTGWHPTGTIARGAELAPTCGDISAIGADANTTIQHVYYCVSANLCTAGANYFSAQGVAQDFCQATNQGICKAQDCNSCHGLVQALPAPGAPKFVFAANDQCPHFGEGTCYVNVPVGAGGLKCQCGC